MKKNRVSLAAFTITFLLTACSGGVQRESNAAVNTTEAVSEIAETTEAGSVATQEAPKELTKISVAYHPGLASLCVPGVGEGEGYFAEEGLEINWVKFTAGPTEIAAMVSGDLQFGYIGHGAHNLCAQGQAHVISLSHISNSEQILTRSDSGIKTIEDLKGKRVVTQLGTSGETILNLALEKAGLTREDIDVYAMDMSGAVSAFIAGQADAIASWDTHTVNIKKNLDVELVTLAETADFVDEMAFPASWVATPEYLEENRDVAVRFIRALNKCYDFRAADMDATVQYSADFGGLPYADIDASRNSAVFYDSNQLKKMVETGSIYDIYQSQLDGFISTGKAETGDVKKYVRVDLMKETFENN